jgi:hypothetical protein
VDLDGFHGSQVPSLVTGMVGAGQGVRAGALMRSQAVTIAVGHDQAVEI